MRIIIGLLFITFTNSCFGLEYSCLERFDIVDGDTINYVDTNCFRQGYWDYKFKFEGKAIRIQGHYVDDKQIGHWIRIEDYEAENEIIKQGEYKDGRKIKTWVTHNSENIIINKEEYMGGVLLKEISVNNGVEKTISQRTFIAFLVERYTTFYMVIVLGAFWVRIFINSSIYNTIDGTSFFILLLFPWQDGAMLHGLKSALTFNWKKKEKDKQKTEKRLSNLLTYAFAIPFFIVILNVIIEEVINYNL